VPESGSYYLVGLEGEARGVRLRVGDLVRIGPGERRGLSPNDLDALGSCVLRLEYVPVADRGERRGEDTSSLGSEALLQEARLKHDLALAAQIQRSLLPREVIAVQGLDLFAEYRAASSVGGDFYDVLWGGTDRLAVFVGDISGKGISAALLMARISSELRVAALAHVDPVAVLSAINAATLDRGQPELFFTAVYFTLDVKTGEIALANAGHPMPYVRRADGRVQPVTGGRACPIGILENAGFSATRSILERGDSLVLYTDGVIEAVGLDGSFYAAQGPMNDDLTLLICQRSMGTTATMQPRRRSSRFPMARVPKI